MITRLPSNLRSTTRECVYLVTRGNFRSHDKDGGHTIQSAISKTPCYTQTSWLALCFVEPESFPMEVLHWGNDRGLLLWPWPWLDDLRIWTWPVLPGDISDVQIWIFYVKAFESYRLTDRTEIIYHAAPRVVNKLLTTREAAWYIISVVSICLTDENCWKPWRHWQWLGPIYCF